VWPRDLCYVRYWRRNDDGSYGIFLSHLESAGKISFIKLVGYLSRSFCEVVLFRSREHENCGPQPGCVRAHLESTLRKLIGFNSLISYFYP